MKTFNLIIFLFCFSFLTMAQNAGQEEWETIFNGKNLKGWTPKIRNYPAGENFGNTFRVKDGKITVAYDAYQSFDERFGHLF